MHKPLMFTKMLHRQRLLPRHNLPGLILGSAPDPHLPKIKLDKVNLICVNSSGWSARRLGLQIPDLTVLLRHKLLAQDTREDLKAMKSLKTHKLLVVPHASLIKFSKIKDVLTQLDYQYNEIINCKDKVHVIKAITGENLGEGDPHVTKVSNGLFAVCLALFYGAPEVIMTGFSLTASGHNYYAERDKHRPRQHILPDKKAILAMRDRGLKIKTSEPDLARETGIELV